MDTTEISALRAQLQGGTQLALELDQSLSAAEQFAQRAEARIELLEAEQAGARAGLTQLLNELEATGESITLLIEEAAATRGSLEEELEARAAEISALAESLAEALHMLEDQLSALEAPLQAQRARLDGSLETLRGALDEQRREAHAAQATVLDAISALEGQLGALQTQLSGALELLVGAGERGRASLREGLSQLHRSAEESEALSARRGAALSAFLAERQGLTSEALHAQLADGIEALTRVELQPLREALQSLEGAGDEIIVALESSVGRFRSETDGIVTLLEGLSPFFELMRSLL